MKMEEQIAMTTLVALAAWLEAKRNVVERFVNGGANAQTEHELLSHLGAAQAAALRLASEISDAGVEDAGVKVTTQRGFE
jgi:hypothetical protein